MKHYDIVVVGGGVVGLASAYGMAKRHAQIAVLDEADMAFRASCSNFGLVWFQGKGLGNPAYVHLLALSTNSWAHFARELRETSGIDPHYHQQGGLSLCVGEAAAERRRAHIEALRKQSGADGYRCEFLTRGELEQLFAPLRLSDEVRTASYCEADGHVNPLYLLLAMQKRFVDLGGHYHGGHTVRDIIPHSGGGFVLNTDRGYIGCDRLLLAAGLGVTELARKIGLEVPIRPERGQIIVTQRTKPLFPLPMNGFRQTQEGSILLGYSKEDVGLDDTTSVAVTARIANNALKAFPQLASLRVVRTWAGLRTQSLDSYPIYAASREWPGAYAVICHSGITLTAAHAEVIPEWVLNGNTHEFIREFGLERFRV
ncbi:NAD(P)/FAD-dependent oxidoreductase [Peristeroidobacter agariperforans]|uniref:NAD(P)/FAD-dependent oxidoreductase n=1 Tax=Peristeroidobacter agariperforans TaxID=268404 RepID=UPI00101D6D21|nr:FAD-dependent oxidoreductase [Peristeroidobacter agariperforans]